jgi:DNA-binding CsgD family transcriptional regulator
MSHPADQPLTDLERGRAAHQRRAWREAFDALSRADQSAPLAGEDLERQATSAYLLGRSGDFLKLLERAYDDYLKSEQPRDAVRCAFWQGFYLTYAGEAGRATGWLQRAQRLVEREAEESVEQGYLLIPVAQQQFRANDSEATYATADRAAKIGERFHDPALIAYARHIQGRTRIREGRVQQGLALLDEAMVSVATGELPPVMTGVIFCSVLDGCQQVYALDRAREWSAAMLQWVEAQPDLVAFSGACLVQRAEIMQLRGTWPDAIEVAGQAYERCMQEGDQRIAGAGRYQQAEVRRLQGEFAAADEEYRRASQLGWEPQPGLSLLRVAQGQTGAAVAAIRRVLSATTEPLRRARVLPAAVEVWLAAGDLDQAREASRELEKIAEHFESDVLTAMAAHARGAVDLAAGDAESALGYLTRVCQVWQQIEAPYLTARVRVLIAEACRCLGDEEGAALELEAARAIFDQLGAAPDLTRLSIPTRAAEPPSRRTAEPPNRLTARELQVLRLVADGKTNKVIAAELRLSEKTVDRHVSNIFGKLGVSSRAAATAWAFREKVIAD